MNALTRTDFATAASSSRAFSPRSTAPSLSVGIVGASGHAGGELCRLLLLHDHVSLIMPASRTPQPFGLAHPNLLGCGLEFVSSEDLRAAARKLDVVFFCTPSGEAMQQARHFLDAGCRVIDLGPDFRFADAAAYARAYGREHAAPDLLQEAVYGATELHRARLAEARLVANPGCYAFATLLALAPAVRADLIDLSHDIHVSAVNGTSGASSTPMAATHHANAANGMLAYSMEGHRHGPELEQELSALAGRDVRVVMTTQHGPFPRGIQAVVTARAHPRHVAEIRRSTLTQTYLEAYGHGREGEYFVVVNPFDRGGEKNEKEYHLYPNVARLAGSNFCQIGLDVDPDRGHIKIVSAIDNLGKGAAGSAIQNMNLMVGLPEWTGLRAMGL